MSEMAATAPKKMNVGRSPRTLRALAGAANAGAASSRAGGPSASAGGASAMRGSTGSLIRADSYDTLRGTVEFSAGGVSSAPWPETEASNAPDPARIPELFQRVSQGIQALVTKHGTSV